MKKLILTNILIIGLSLSIFSQNICDNIFINTYDNTVEKARKSIVFTEAFGEPLPSENKTENIFSSILLTTSL